MLRKVLGNEWGNVRPTQRTLSDAQIQGSEINEDKRRMHARAHARLSESVCVRACV